MNDAHQTSVFLLPFAGFFVVIGIIWLVGIASFVLGIAALISVARQPLEAFGPWWDNTRSSWLIGIAVSFVLPFGTLVTGIAWFRSGAVPLRRRQGPAVRPFWAGPAKPYPPYPPYAPPAGYPPPGSPPAPYSSPPPPYDPPPHYRPPQPH